MKPLHIGLAGILSGVLLGLSYLPWSPILTAFVAIVPLLRILPKIRSLQMIAVALLANLLAFGIADWTLWQRMGVMGGTSFWCLEAAIMTLPWALGHLIYHRHNPKLGYVALVTSWLMLEWTMGQWLGPWQGLQLGMSPIWLPALVQWYSFLGVTGGTMWLLAINIQLTRYLWPATAHTRKSALYSGLAVLILPLLISGAMWMMQQDYDPATKDVTIGIFAPSAEFHQPKDLRFRELIFTNTDGKGIAYFKKEYPGVALLMGEGQAQNSFFYDIANDTLKEGRYKAPNENYKKLQTNGSTVADIMGMVQRHWLIDKQFAGKTGLLNNATLPRSETVRTYARQGCNLIFAFSATRKTDNWSRQRQQAHAIARAIELRRHLVFSTSDGAVLSATASGNYKLMKVDREVGTFAISASGNSFFSNYGDLPGRLSIFVSIWLALGTIVKPYRKK